MISIMRHGTTEFNKKKLLQGRIDNPMCKEGIQEVKVSAKYLTAHYNGNNVTHVTIYSSPLKRCVETSSIVKRELVKYGIECNISFDERLSEMSFGFWEGKSKKDISQIELQKRSDNIWEYVIPGGESYKMVFERCKGFYKDVLLNNNECILIVAHEKTCQCIDSLINNTRNLLSIRYKNGEFKNHDH